MRVFGLGLVALAALSAYGLVLHDQLSHDVAVSATAGHHQTVASETAANQDLSSEAASAIATTAIVTAAMPAGEIRSAQASDAASTTAAEPAAPAPASAPAPLHTKSNVEASLFVPPIVTPNPALAGLEAAPTAAPSAVTPPVSVPPSLAVTPVPAPAAASPAAPAAPAPTQATGPQAPVAADPRVAKVAFGAATTAAPMAARAIGFYSRGCLAGARMLPVDGPAWQAMRLSRNRNWGHPVLVRFVEKLAMDARAQDGWPGLLVGDLSQPRGGPMLTGHASHQIGLDADVWFTPMPDRRLTPQERENLAATDMLGPTKLDVDAQAWKPEHVALVKRAASFPEVERVLVHPAIKKALCEAAGPATAPGREWLHKVRPYWGHHYHFHVRVACPDDSASCKGQAPPANDDGCGKELDDWFKVLSRPPKPVPVNPVPAPPPKQILVEQLPAECRQVLDSGEPGTAVHAASTLPSLPMPRRARSPAAAKATAKAVARVKAKAKAQARRAASK